MYAFLYSSILLYPSGTHSMCIMYIHVYLDMCRSHLRTEVEVLTGKLERANLAKSMADSKLSELDRYKAMIELEMNEILARHKTAMTEKMARAVQVSRGEGGREREVNSTFVVCRSD